MSQTREPPIFGAYTLFHRLSGGGMAEVFRARDTRSGATVAIKRILPSIAEDEDFVEMFLDEARIASELEHPHIARLLDFGEVEQAYFIAYELVDGKDLRAIFTQAIEASEPPPLSFLLYIFSRIAEALAYAHARKDEFGLPKAIVHRDVSPQNIVVSYTGDVKLIDFGIAKARGRLSKTSAGTIKGKFGYMSPEQISGGDVDQRTDVFSLGICMWELLTLKRLFTGPNEILVLDMVKRHVPDPPSAFRGDLAASPWGGELDRIVMKALAKDADERYRSARELFKDLYVFVEKISAIASRDDVARTMRASFREEALRSLGSTMELQEQQRMSDESNKNLAGSDLDIFEGLGKKSAPKSSATPPPPPASGNPPGNFGVKQLEGMKKTLVGLSSPSLPPSASQLPVLPPPSSPPPASASMRVSQPVSQPPQVTTQSSVSKPPPPPPGRASLPAISAPGGGSQPPSATQKAVPSAATTMPGGVGTPAPSQIPAPPSTRPTLAAGRVSAPPPLPTAAQSGPNQQKLDMDWSDDEEATHVFDKESRDKIEAAPPVADRADMDAILSSPPQPPAAGTPPPPAPATLSGAFANLGSSPPSSAFRSGPPASQSIRSAPPPPPGSFQHSPAPPSVNGAGLPPPPPPPGQTTTAPMHMPPRPPSGAPGSISQHPSSMPPAHMQHPSNHPSHHPQTVASQPPVHMPPVSRAMEATQMVPRQQPSKAPLVIGLLLAVAAIVGAAVFFLMPRTGTLVVNVADSKGGAVSGLEVTVDGTKKCDSAPCIVRDIAKGAHEVKVSATGYDTPAARGVSIESGKEEKTDFTLNTAGASKTAGGTGVKVAGNQTGVKLSIDGKEIGALPQEVKDLEPGEHKLHFAGDRYASLDKTVSVGKDEMVDVGNVALKVTKGKATIQLGTPGAKVYLVSGTNRKEVPSFPIAIDFDPAEKWQLEAKLTGYDDFVQPISFDDGQAEKTYTIAMNAKGSHPATTPANATTPPAAAVANTDPKPAAVTEPKPATTPAPAAAGGDEAFLNINSLPASTVVLDGKPLGPTPKVHVSVTPGSHTILFVNAELSLKKSVSVTVKGGETKPVTAKLRD